MANKKDSDSAPFTDEDLAKIKQNLAMLDEAEAIIAKAKRGGIEMAEQEKTVREQREQLTKLKNSFFPGR